MDEEAQMKNVRNNERSNAKFYPLNLKLPLLLIFHKIVVVFQIKEFLQNYNKITDDCFSQCVYTLSHSRLTDEEVYCFTIIVLNDF